MILIDVPQRSPEWFDIRRKYFTASEIGKWLIEEPKCWLTKEQISEILTTRGIDHKKVAKKEELEALLSDREKYLGYTKASQDARYSAICAKLAEISGCEMPPMFDNWATRRGNELEPDARREYERRTGNTVEEVGFAIHDSGAFGCSPDGLINERRGNAEIKCPLPHTHVAYLLDGGLPDEYEMQVHTQMAACGTEYCDFCSFCPPLPPLIVRVERSEMTDRIEAAMIRLHGDFLVYKARIARIWDDLTVQQAERASA